MIPPSTRIVTAVVAISALATGAAGDARSQGSILQEAIDLARDGMHREALPLLARYVDAVPEDPDGHLHLARTLLALSRLHHGSLAPAIRELETARGLAPDRVDIAAQLAEAYGLRRPGTFDPERALGIHESLIEAHPERSDLRLALVRWLFDEEIRLLRQSGPRRVAQDSGWTMDLARHHLERALDRIAPGTDQSLDARVMLGEMLFRSGEWEAARRLFEELLPELERRGLNAGMAWHTIGHCHYRRGRMEEAAAAFRRAFDIVPHDYYRYAIAVAYDGLGGYPETLPQRYRFPRRPESVDPRSPPRRKFTDIAPRLHVNKYAGAGPAGWADYDGDGRFDLIVCGCDVYCTLYRGTPGGFVDATTDAGLRRLEPGFATAWADYDNDGDPDLYIARNGWNGAAPNSLLRNDGDGTFTDVAVAAGLDDGGSSFHAAWLDYDRDGWLDLVVSNGVYLDGSTNRLYRNRGDGVFVDMTGPAGLSEEPGYGTIGVAVGDIGGDGWTDIFFHGRGEPNRLYRNLGDGRFREVAEEAGVAGPGTQNGYIALMSDLDSDGDLDLFTGSLAPWEEVLAGYQPGFTAREHDHLPRFYRNRGDGTFEDASIEAGFRYPLGIMAAGIADLDNDGYQDIYLGTGNPEIRRLEPNILYHNRGGDTFEDVTRYAGLGALGKGHGITFIDWDEDGDLDIFAELGGFFHGDLWDSAFYRNEEGSRNHRLGIRLRQEGRNRDAIGARVTVHAGELAQVQEVTAGRGFGSTDPPVLHFGLGSRSRVDRVTIRWPDGLVQTMDDVETDQTLSVQRPGTPYDEPS